MAAAPELLNLEKFKTEVHRILISKLDLEKLSRVESSLRGTTGMGCTDGVKVHGLGATELLACPQA